MGTSESRVDQEGSNAPQNVICASCKRIIKGATLPKNEMTPFVRPHCNKCADVYNQVEKKSAICRNCGDIKLVPKDTNLENGVYCSECAAMKRALLERRIASGISGSGNIHFAIEN
ncbi:PREDICTED: uncharacterized protein LOC109586400 [Amphimedon queenslandica]|uniref:Uncharacterized protein n=1 Tax=Amphimedon queenslandica TaxID=400682 RepID=A0A1X7VQB6_AMPQE|nr:PREDICTED: uncharacterized protein LOC109586400 [Amphimedon queenslandica]|eukprot:XP_019858150.1 PREDICTED: uncharacterized protein LOC109586400 [Amphimedon queenslandica]